MVAKDNRIDFKLESMLQKNLKIKDNKLLYFENAKASDFALVLGIKLESILKKFKLSSPESTLNSNQITELALFKKIDIEKIKYIDEKTLIENFHLVLFSKKWPPEAKEIQKVPIVTIMGHVDHGKTTLLDKIRKSNLVAKELGGITQKIGAYQVSINNSMITFIDTPGHEAFTKLRLHGSLVTDIILIVVAADDSIMPQTIEAINHAKDAKVDFIVVINKIDKPNADVKKVIDDLAKLNVLSESWGGNIPFVEISAVTGEGLEKLFETIILLAELKGLKVYENMIASGTVIESKIDKTKGNVATLLVRNGTLKIGDKILIGNFTTNVKMLINDLGKSINNATPSTPVEIFGLGSSVEIGTNFVVVNNDQKIEKFIEKILEENNIQAKTNESSNKKSIEELFEKKDIKKQLNIIFKVDNSAILDALLLKTPSLVGNTGFEINIVHSGIGEITNTDILLAKVSNSIIYTFNIKLSEAMKKEIQNKGVILKGFGIIYELFEDIEKLISIPDEKKIERVQIGEVEVLAIFEYSKIGKIAGCVVKVGKVTSKSIIEVYRDKNLIVTSNIASLKFQKDNVKERPQGSECGIVLENFSDFQIGDKFVVFEDQIANKQK